MSKKWPWPNKGTVLPVHAIKEYGGSRNIAPLVLNLGTG